MTLVSAHRRSRGMNAVPKAGRSRGWAQWAARTLRHTLVWAAGICPAGAGLSAAEPSPYAADVLPPLVRQAPPAKFDSKITTADVPAPKTTAHFDPAVVPAGCSTCGGGLLGGLGSVDAMPGLPPTGEGFGTPGPGNCGGCCYPGRTSCCDCCSDNCL